MTQEDYEMDPAYTNALLKKTYAKASWLSEAFLCSSLMLYMPKAMPMIPVKRFPMNLKAVFPFGILPVPAQCKMMLMNMGYHGIPDKDDTQFLASEMPLFNKKLSVAQKS